MAITVNRGGVTANYWYDTGIKAKADVFGEELKIRFQLDSKGGGITQVQVNIARSSFQELLEGMLDCDFEHTINAFARSIVQRQAKLS
jgi:hypothetical protein